jgi:TonB family protein
MLMFMIGCETAQQTDYTKEYIEESNQKFARQAAGQRPDAEDPDRVTEAEVDRLFAKSPGYRPISFYREGRRVPPKLVSFEYPEYPSWAEHEALQAMVTVAARVGTDGSVLEVKVVRSTSARLNDVAVAAMKKWRFEPGKIDGEPQPLLVVVPLEVGPDGWRRDDITNASFSMTGLAPHQL